jgi:predicted permease
MNWRRFFERRRRYEDLSNEINSYIEHEIERNLAHGMDDESAQNAAQRKLGSRTLVQEEVYRMNSVSWIEAIGRDLHHAGRVLRRSPWFTVAATLAVALGIGANTTVFSVVNAVLLRPLPYREPDRLYAVESVNLKRGGRDKVTGADFRDWRARNRVFQDTACYWDESHTITGTDKTETLIGWEVTPNLFPLLGTPPLLGRTFTADDVQRGNQNVVVLSHGLWQRRFGGEPNIVGQAVQLDANSYTILGVMPAGFAHPDSRTEIWTPFPYSPDTMDDRRLHVLRVIGRVRPGVSGAQARREMEGIGKQLAQERPESNAMWGVEVRPIRDLYSGGIKTALVVLQIAVLFTLLISCANVANLLLARATARDREVAVRLALGAGRGRLFRQFLAEGVLIAVLGAAAGLMLAVWSVQVLPTLFDAQLRRLVLPKDTWGWIDSTVIAWILGVAAAISLAFAVTPLLRGFGDLNESLQAGSRGSTGSGKILRLRNVLAVSQIAFSLVLLSGAGLLIRSFLRLQERPLGFRTDHVLTVFVSSIAPRDASANQVTAILEQIEERVRSVPGVQSVGFISTLPLSGNNARRRYRLPGQAEAPNIETELAEFRLATPDYFQALGIPLRKGRYFNRRDRAGAPGVVIVNQTLARRLWPNENPLGKSLIVPDMVTPETREVIGVVGDTRHNGLETDPVGEIYRPAYQASWPFFSLAVGTSANPLSQAKSVTDAIAAVRKDIPIGGVRTMEQLAAETIAMRRSSMILLAVFAAVSLLIASFGIYSVIAYAVAQRAKEMGIRMALGASPGDVLKQTLQAGALLGLVGVGVGLALSFALTRFLGKLLYGVTPSDPMTLASVSALVLAVAVFATLAPAMAAARLDPSITLRSD